MAVDEIAEVRALLAAKPRPVGWSERRERLDEVGSIWPVAADIALEAIIMDGVPGEWSIAPGSDPAKVLMMTGGSHTNNGHRGGEGGGLNGLWNGGTGAVLSNATLVNNGLIESGKSTTAMCDGRPAKPSSASAFSALCCRTATL